MRARHSAFEGVEAVALPYDFVEAAVAAVVGVWSHCEERIG